ncbi:MAG: glycosyltransferase family 9 protein [Planctomycetota bacterium]
MRILITRLSHIGDCVLTLPLACSLKAQFPRATIAWVTERPNEQLLQGHPAIDELVVLPKGWFRKWSTIRETRARLRALDCQVSIDPQGLTKSSVLGWLSGAPKRIGFESPHGRELSTMFNTDRVRAARTHLVDRSLELLFPLGFSHDQVKFALQAKPASRAFASDFIKANHLACGYAIINPGASWPSKLWPPRRFGQVARQLGQVHQVPTVVTWSGEEERRWAEEIAARSGGHAVLAPATSLNQLLAILEQGLFYIGSDTGPTHMAAAVGTPCIVLHGPTKPECSGAYGKPHVALQAYYHEGSSRARRRADNTAMKAIEVETVWRAAERVLAQREGLPRLVA